MPANFRPTGVTCNSYIYSDGTKESPYMRFKRFLFEQDSGRTDVVFLCSAASGLETKTDTFDSNEPALYHSVGGLIDGIAKAIVVGNSGTGRPSRSLYATSVKYGYESNVVPNWDTWDSNTWLNPNTTGAGGFLAGTSTAYGSYFYYTRGSKKQTGWQGFSFYEHSGSPHSLQANLNFSSGVVESVPWNIFTPLSGYSIDPSEVTNNSSRELKFTTLFSKTLCEPTNILLQNVEYANPNAPSNFSISQTPEQPQRFWKDTHPWVINPTVKCVAIGIGYIENGVVTSIFNDAQNFGYVPNGLNNGLTENDVVGLGLYVYSLNSSPNGNEAANHLSEGAWQFRGAPAGTFEMTLTTVAEFNTLINWNTLFSAVSNKKLIVRHLTIDEIISIRNLNIKATPPANKTEFDNYDGYRVSAGRIVMRWMWANPDTLPGKTIEENKTKANRTMQSWGLALTSVDNSVSPQQNGLPYLRTFGTKSSVLSNSAFNLYNWCCARTAVTTDVDYQYPGIPLVLSTMNPCGLFALTKQDIPELIGTSPAPTIDKDRCMLIHPNFGLVYNGISSLNGGLLPTSRDLTTQEKNNLLGIFKSPDFKYVSSVFYYDDYSGNAGTFPERKAGIAPYVSPKIVFTGQSKSDLSGSSYVDIQNPYVATHYIGNTITFDGTTKRQLNRVIQAVPFNLSTINNSWNQAEFRFGFVGKNSNEITGGSFLLGIHYGIDTANTNGIAFTKLIGDYRFRTGDMAYTKSNEGVYNSGMLEVFRAIAERQKNNPNQLQLNLSTPTTNVLNSQNSKKKLIIFWEVGIWENANPNASYLGINAYGYLSGQSVNNLTGKPLGEQGLSALAPFENLLLLSGFSRDEFVIVFYTPSHLTRTNVPAIDNTLNIDTYPYSISQRSTFQRAAEIFNNNILFGNGLYNAGRSISIYNQYVISNSFYVNFGSIPTIATNLSQANVQPNAASWYVFDGVNIDYTQFTPEASLAIGESFIEYIHSATTPTVNFVPPWIPPFSKMLNYTTDPVSGADFAFVTVSTDPVDIEPYLVELDAIIDNQGSAFNDQATRTLCYFKTKTLQ